MLMLCVLCATHGERETERRFRVYKEAPGLRPGPRLIHGVGDAAEVCVPPRRTFASAAHVYVLFYPFPDFAIVVQMFLIICSCGDTVPAHVGRG